jgi:hypothetical protein
MIAYYVHIGERNAAKLYYNMLRQLAPKHPATKRAKRILYPSLRIRIIRWLEKQIQRYEEKELNAGARKTRQRD